MINHCGNQQHTVKTNPLQFLNALIFNCNILAGPVLDFHSSWAHGWNPGFCRGA